LAKLSYKSFKELFTPKIFEKVKLESDDFIITTRTLGELYENVEDDLKDISIQVFEVHLFPEEHRDRIAAFLNEEPYNNSVNFIKK
jgi:hypothetical protein